MKPINLEYSLKDPEMPGPTPDLAMEGSFYLQSRILAHINPGETFMVPLNMVIDKRLPFIAMLNYLPVTHGARIASGPLATYSEIGELRVAIQAVDPLWDVDLSQVSVTLIPMQAVPVKLVPAK